MHKLSFSSKVVSAGPPAPVTIVSMFSCSTRKTVLGEWFAIMGGRGKEANLGQQGLVSVVCSRKKEFKLQDNAGSFPENAPRAARVTATIRQTHQRRACRFFGQQSICFSRLMTTVLSKTRSPG